MKQVILVLFTLFILNIQQHWLKSIQLNYIVFRIFSTIDSSR